MTSIQNPNDAVISSISTLSCSMPIPAFLQRSNMVDPATAAAIVKAAIAFIQQQNFSDWQHDVSAKLDEISRKLDVVILELQRLRGYIDQRITRESIDLFEGQINARRKTIEQIMSGLPKKTKDMDDTTRQRLIRIMDEMDLPVCQLMNWKKYSFDPYNAVIVGSLTKLLLLSLTGRQPAESKTFAVDVVSYFKQAIDLTNPNSLASYRNAKAASAIQANSEFTGYLDRWWQIAEHHGRAGPNEDGFREITTIRTYGKASGSLEGGITVATSNRIGGTAPWYPPHPDRENGMTGDTFKAHLEKTRSFVLNLIVEENTLREHTENIAGVIPVLEQVAK